MTNQAADNQILPNNLAYLKRTILKSYVISSLHQQSVKQAKSLAHSSRLQPNKPCNPTANEFSKLHQKTAALSMCLALKSCVFN